MFSNRNCKLLFLIWITVCFNIDNRCIAQNNIYVTGSLFGRQFSTSVDSQLAAEMLNNNKDSIVAQFFSNYQDTEIDSDILENITEKYSLDVATLFLLQKLYEQPENKHAQDAYYLLSDTFAKSDLKERLAILKDFHIVFIPGFKYKANAGNFLAQRNMLETAHISYELVNIDEVGLVEDNAAIVAERLKEINKVHSKIILISVSKGGLETAIALGKLLNTNDLASVKAWINVCGILKGTPVADYWSKPFKKLWLSCGLFCIGKHNVNLKGLLNCMSYIQCKERYKTLKIPSNIYTVNLLATEFGREKKSIIRQPNDGYSPLLDSIIGNGAVVIEAGTDHTFKNRNLNVRMVSLLHYIVEHLKNET
jgi:hypothetical protein